MIEFVEVGPRDGLQNERLLVGTADKLRLIEHALDCGARRFEVASFVNPHKVPQMADAEAVCAGLPPRSDATYIGLVLNASGAERALATGRIDHRLAGVMGRTLPGMAAQAPPLPAAVP